MPIMNRIKLFGKLHSQTGHVALIIRIHQWNNSEFVALGKLPSLAIIVFIDIVKRFLVHDDTHFGTMNKINCRKCLGQ